MLKPGKILFIDPLSLRPYNSRSLASEPLGGTEATVIRVLKALSGTFDITLAQSARKARFIGVDGINYIPFDYHGPPAVSDPDVVIVLRSHKILTRVRSLYPRSSMLLWLHCFPGKHRKKLNDLAVRTRCRLITVSDIHRREVEAFMYQNARNPEHEFACIERIYNPVSDSLHPESTPYDPDKLFYFSSPHKGLPQVLKTFSRIHRHMPRLRLYVANPGYMWMKNFPEQEGVVNLGALPHREIIRHVREALCVFHPQSQFRETSGLVLAEANAVGTPVIAHPIGATPEVLQDHSQIINADDPEEVERVLKNWQNGGRPRVSVNREFRCSRVARQWQQLIDSMIKLRSDSRKAQSA